MLRHTAPSKQHPVPSPPKPLLNQIQAWQQGEPCSCGQVRSCTPLCPGTAPGCSGKAPARAFGHFRSLKPNVF